MKRFLLLSSLLASTLAMHAQVTPKVKPETLVAGKQYVLVNRAQTASQYMSRTSWDGALYFLGETDSKYANYALTAVDNGDGTWSFTLPNESDESAPYYMGIPSGTNNLNANLTTPVKWTIESSEKYTGFYQLIAGAGNNENCIGRRLHLNSGVQYFVISEPINGGAWYPDFAGGAERTGEYDIYDEEIIIINDSTSFNWGFLQVGNVPDYYADLQYSGSINNFYTNYCDIEDYAEGFLATYNATKSIYETASDIDELFDSDLLDMLANKVELYEEIEKAIALNEDDDAVLAAAIATAQTAFTQKTAANEVEAATQALAQAELNYSMGNGDITALGKNMSFEDLSAQNGAATSGVAAPPAGWNVFINGKQVTTTDEVKTAGIANWHGVNADCNGDIKDGSYGFGIWTSSVPQYELSQTIEGLDNGSYLITAGLMVGANGSGSRRTTQRIFGNLNSTYFGAQELYNEDKLDNLEVYTFAGLEEPVTDAEMQTVEVRAFVYDGTLTFGVRTDGNIAAANRTQSNGAGGDGWFKTDNYTIQKLGYDADDAIAVFDHYIEVLEEYNYNSDYMMAESVRNTLEESLNAFDGITTSSSQNDIIQGILAAKELLATTNVSIKAYEKLLEALEQHYNYRDQYENKKGIGAYSDVIDEAEAAYYDGSVENEAAIDAIIEGLNEALLACIQSDDIEEGSDLTDYIQNASFEDLSNQNNSNSSGVVNAPKGWDLYLNGTQVHTASEIQSAGVIAWCAINSGDAINVELEDESVVTNQYSDGEHLWGIWNDNIPEVELSQVLRNMPAGLYTLTCDVLVQYNWAGYCITTQRIFANDYVAMYSYEENYENNLPEDAQIAVEIDKLVPDADVKHLTYAGHECFSPRSDYSNKVTLQFGLAESGDIKLGFRTNNIDKDGVAQNRGIGWFKLDNFRLTYESTEVPAGAETTGEATTIDDVEIVEKGAVEFYSLDGIRLSAPQKGINIVKKNGYVTKIMVR